MAADTAEGEFRVPEDVEAERAAEAADENAVDTLDDDEQETKARRRWLRADAAPVDLADVDLARTPGPMVAAVALGVVAAPLLGVYAVLFITRYFLRPGVSPDITSSWAGEGIAGVVAAVFAVVMLVVVARAAAGRGLPVFVASQLVVVGACAFLLSDSSYGGRSVTIVVGVVAVVATVCAVLPVSRRWFAAHALDRAAQQ